MVERRGNIGHREGSIAGKEQKRSIVSEIVKRERDAYKKVLGIEPEIKPLPEYITSEIIKNLEKLGMGLRNIPKLNLGTLDELKTVGEEEFLKRLERRYPNWKRFEGLGDTEKKDPSISRNLEERYWKWIKEENVEFPQLNGQWMAVETIPKPLYGEKYKPSPVRKWDRFGVSWKNATRYIETEIRNSYLLTQVGLPKNSDVRLLEPVEWNLLANRQGWGQTDTYEWTNTKFRMPDDDFLYRYWVATSPIVKLLKEVPKYEPAEPSDALIVGSSKRGGAAGVNFRFIDGVGSPYRNIGFRAAVILPRLLIS